MATVHLVDASPYIFRAYFSLPATIVDRAGLPVNAVYGFTAFVLKLVETERPTHLGVAFDRSLTTSFRNEVYPAYKAQRTLPPPELEAQLDACLEIAGALGAATFIDDRYEADDLIATVAVPLERAGHSIVVVTSDKDLAQLVSDRVTLFDFGKETRLTPREVEAKFGVRPDQIPDLLGLAGDTVDNIPGVKGIGAKTAAELLARFGHLEELYERLGELPRSGLRGARSLYGKLAEGREIALLSKQLATAARDAPVGPCGLADLAYRGPDLGRLEPLFDRLGFKEIRKRIAGMWAPDGSSTYNRVDWMDL